MLDYYICLLSICLCTRLSMLCENLPGYMVPVYIPCDSVYLSMLISVCLALYLLIY